MAKRTRLEIIKDILSIIKENHNSIRITPLIRKSNLSSQRFNEYFKSIKQRNFVREVINSEGRKQIELSEAGFRFLEKYQTIKHFIEEFDL